LRKAVIDLGTNTFHLLIVDQSDEGFEIIHRERVYVKLGRKGIGHIPEEAFSLGINSLKSFSQSLNKFNVKYVKALGTEMLRKADNGRQFIIIGGKKEAFYISKGVMSILPEEYSRIMIMDIGGGSVEFILVIDKEVIQSESFPIGVAVLKNSFHKSEPISTLQISQLNSFVENKLSPVKSWIKEYNPEILVGASGSFEVLSDIKHDKEAPNYSEINLQLFNEVFSKVICLNLEERITHSEIPKERADLFVVAMLLIKFVLDEMHVIKIGVSQYAMKEGILLDDF
jgi:exopolyphosphatase/guanosine-5'-triphosphate,3'-diphosphate pyrophosphatase